MPDLFFVDTHVHVVAADQQRYPLSPVEGHVNEWVEAHPVTAEELAADMQAKGVQRAVLVQAGSAYGYANDYPADAAAADPTHFTAACIIDMSAPDAADRLEYWVRERGMRGMRLYTTPDEDARSLDDPGTYPVWRRAEALNIPINIQLRAKHLPRFRPMAERFPGVRVALDHIGNAVRGDSSQLPQVLLDLAQAPNVYLKWSSVNLDAVAEAGIEFRAVLEPLLERFGAGRLPWGSNYPATYHHPYGELVQAARDATRFVSDADRALLFGGAALQLYPHLAP